MNVIPTARAAGYRGAVSFLLIAAGFSACGRDTSTSEPTAKKEITAEQSAALIKSETERARVSRDVKRKTKTVREVFAVWYDVPVLSLARRRAAGEFTAAHNRLPLGTLVKVTHLANGKSVLVRITDRGIRDRRVKIDLCKEAAEQLGMISEGMAKVRLEVLEDDSKVTATAAKPAALQ